MSDTLIARQPIMDKQQKIYAYEILSRSSPQENSTEETHTAISDEKQLFNILSTFGMDKLLDGKLAFLNCVLQNNNLEYFDLISPKNVILEVQKPLPENKQTIDQISQKMAILKLKGYKIALGEWGVSSNYESCLKHVDYVKIDSTRFEPAITMAMIKKIKKLNKQIVIEKIETYETFEMFSKTEADYFQGYYFCKPIIMSAKVSSPAAVTLIKLINLTMQQAEIKEIEAHLKTDPSLSFRLFKYMNSYGVSGGIKIESFQKAIMILGYKNLLKWLSILFTTTQKNASSDLLAKTALVRAKFMENICTLLPENSQPFREAGFIVGLFSLLDAMLNVPMDVAMGAISLPTEITDAVLHKKGKLAELLNLVVSLENNEWIDVFANAYSLGLDKEKINKCYVDAIEWSNSLNL